MRVTTILATTAILTSASFSAFAQNLDLRALYELRALPALCSWTDSTEKLDAKIADQEKAQNISESDRAAATEKATQNMKADAEACNSAIYRGMFKEAAS